MVTFLIYSKEFQTSSIHFGQKVTYQDPKILNKIWLERAWNEEQLFL
jgi:hypothetical protein